LKEEILTGKKIWL